MNSFLTKYSIDIDIDIEESNGIIYALSELFSSQFRHPESYFLVPLSDRSIS